MAERTGRHGLMMASIMLATTIYSLDSTIAAVALPHMQGSFATTQEQASWILTSYIVSSAIMTPILLILPGSSTGAPATMRPRNTGTNSSKPTGVSNHSSGLVRKTAW